jgi:hypothetical protein
MSRTLTGFVIVAGLLPAALAGQDARLMRERVAREAEAARAAALVVQEIRTAFQRRARTATDTIMIAGGNIAVVSHADVAPLARAAAAQADSVLGQIVPLLSPVKGTVVYLENDSSSVYSDEKKPIIAMQYDAPPHRSPSRMESGVDAEQIARLIEGTATSRALNAAKLPIYKWRQGNYPLRKEDAREPSWDEVRFEIIDSPSLLGARCYRGDVVSCSMLLGLTPVEDPVMAWYDSSARLNRVKDRRGQALRTDRQLTEACERGDDAACGRLLNAMNEFQNPPGGDLSHDALMWEALRIGGDSAVVRLLTSGAMPAEAIAAAARVPADSVVRAWQRHVREGSLGSNDLTLALVIVSIGWVALLLFLTTRISRWR